MLYLHGGGYVIGSAKLGDPLCARLARHLGVVVAAVDYRLAPEHPHPTPLEDAHAALRWLAAQPEVDARRIALVGESAGGGLAAALSLVVRDAGELRPVLQVLSYPMLDDRTTHGGVDPGVLRLWSQRSNRFGWDAYLGELVGDEVPATAAPARAEELAGLPASCRGVARVRPGSCGCAARGAARLTRAAFIVGHELSRLPLDGPHRRRATPDPRRPAGAHEIDGRKQLLDRWSPDMPHRRARLPCSALVDEGCTCSAHGRRCCW